MAAGTNKNYMAEDRQTDLLAVSEEIEFESFIVTQNCSHIFLLYQLKNNSYIYYKYPNLTT